MIGEYQGEPFVANRGKGAGFWFSKLMKLGDAIAARGFSFTNFGNGQIQLVKSSELPHSAKSIRCIKESSK